ncbi:MAG TPA: phenylalanine--tRNA ligase subunit alpha [Mycobacteriales bacterium]|nr:phenylalanine--tRNA ligase subunit alpha [Mycobacteriales bacterium]
MADYDPVTKAALDPAVLDAARSAALADFAGAADLEALALARTAHLGDRSPLALANREIKVLPPQARKDAGQRVGGLKAELDLAYADRRAALEEQRDARALVEEAVDVTLPWDRAPRGHRHPLTLVQEKVADIFTAMGYEVAEGPLVETEWHNFDALNMPADHPARAMQDTIFLDPPSAGRLLRTHTSPVQIRALLERGAPCYVVAPGRVVRNDPIDATHSPVFHQLECLAVDEGLTMAHLRGTIDALSQAVFGAGIISRLRPSYFPFTEPSAEVDLVCFVCGGAADGCRTCAGEGWIEWGGCGMVHPRVLRACGVDPERYSGYAFGMGLDRLLMFRHGITDLRHLFEGDVRFAEPFGSEV